MCLSIYTSLGNLFTLLATPHSAPRCSVAPHSAPRCSRRAESSLCSLREHSPCLSHGPCLPRRAADWEARTRASGYPLPVYSPLTE